MGKRLLAGLLFLVGLATVIAAPAPTPIPGKMPSEVAVKKMQGTWEVIEVRRGSEAPTADLPRIETGSKIRITGDSWRVTNLTSASSSGGGKMGKVGGKGSKAKGKWGSSSLNRAHKITLDPRQSPCLIDLVVPSSSSTTTTTSSAKPLRGVLTIKGDMLEISYLASEGATDRAKSIGGTPEPRAIYLRLKRVP